jgi:hypothetical protein
MSIKLLLGARTIGEFIRSSSYNGFGCWGTIAAGGCARKPPIATVGDPIDLGREPAKPSALANVRLGAHNGLKSDVAPCPKKCQ